MRTNRILSFVILIFVEMLLPQSRPLASTLSPPPDRYHSAIVYSGSRPQSHSLEYRQPRIANDLYPYTCGVFQRWAGDNWDIIGVDEDGNNSTLIFDPLNDIDPRYNKGCTLLLFSSNREGRYKLFRYNVADHTVAKVGESTGDNYRPMLSPDGSKIVFETTRNGNSEIYVVNADGTNVTRLTNHSGYDGMPFWSPDGSAIAFTSDRNGFDQVFRMQANGSNVVPLSTQPIALSPVWSPDGTQIAYSADNEGDGWLDLWTMNPDGSSQQLLADGPANYDFMAASYAPNMEGLAFTSFYWLLWDGRYYLENSQTLYWHFAYQTSMWFGNQASSGDMYPDWQTFDTASPSSSMTALPGTVANPIFLSWSGSDNIWGVRTYDVQVKDEAIGIWNDWLMGTTSTSDYYNGLGGHRYSFRVRARDWFCNLEAWPAVPDVTTRVENLAPRTRIQALPEATRPGFVVRWSGWDPGDSGIESYSIQYQDGTSGWVDWLTDTTDDSAIFAGVPGHAYSFRSRGLDRAQNQEFWPNQPDATTTVYARKASGGTYDISGAPVNGVSWTSGNPTPFLFTNEEGAYEAFFETEETINMSIGKNGYGSLPETRFSGSADIPMDYWLPPVDNLVQDSGFESGEPTNHGWKTGGDIQPALDATQYHTGRYGMSIGQLPDPALEAPAPIPIDPTMGTGWDSRPTAVLDKNGRVHLFVEIGINDGGDYYRCLAYLRREVNGTWGSPLLIERNLGISTSPAAVIDSSGTIHIIWVKVTWDREPRTVLMYQQIAPGDVWSEPEQISGEENYISDPKLAADPLGRLHVAWVANDHYQVYYRQRDAYGQWSEIEQLGGGHLVHQVLTGADGSAHFLITSSAGVYYLRYAHRLPDGTWGIQDSTASADKPFADISYNYPTPMQIDHQGVPYIVWSGGDLCASTLHPGYNWSVPSCLPQQFADHIQLYIDDNGVAHIAWQGCPGPCGVYYANWEPAQGWSEIRTMATAGLNVMLYGMYANANGDLYFLWSQSGTLMYQAKSHAGDWLTPGVLANGITYEPLSSQVQGNTGSLQLIWQDIEGLDLISEPAASLSGNSSISQVISIPGTMTYPTLGFTYRMAGASQALETGLSLYLDDANSRTTLFQGYQDAPDWTHHSINLGAWTGETITLTLQTHQEAGGYPVWAFVDEVSLGTIYPDIWLSAPQNRIVVRPGEVFTTTLSYGNQGSVSAHEIALEMDLPEGLEFVASSQPPVQTGQTVSFDLGDLPSRSAPGELTVSFQSDEDLPYGTLVLPIAINTTDQELEAINNSTTLEILVDNHVYLYLPTIHYY